MDSHDSWLKIWLSANDLKKSGEYRSPGPLHVYTMTADGSSPQFSGQLSAWADLSKRLQRTKVHMGIVAVEQDPQIGSFQYPGVTIALESPMGGTMIAMQVMNMLSKLGVGGVLAGKEQGGRFGVLRIIMAPRWYAKTHDELFGLDWSTVPNHPVICDEAKLAWAKGMHAVLRTVLNDIPKMFIDTVEFGVFDVVDWLHDLGPRESTYLYEAKPTQLSWALYNLGSWDLDLESSRVPRPFDEGEILKTIFDELEEEVTPEWLNMELSSPHCLVMHVSGRATYYPNIDILIFLLRKQSDGRVRLTVVEISPHRVATRDDCYEVNPEIFKWSGINPDSVSDLEKVFAKLVDEVGDLHKPGMLHLPRSDIKESAYRKILIDWFQKSPSTRGIYELLSDYDLRLITPLFRPNFNWRLVDQRELNKKEATELFGWINTEEQRVLEGQMLLSDWRDRWRAPGFTHDEVLALLKRLGLKTWNGDKLS